MNVISHYKKEGPRMEDRLLQLLQARKKTGEKK